MLHAPAAEYLVRMVMAVVMMVVMLMLMVMAAAAFLSMIVVMMMMFMVMIVAAAALLAVVMVMMVFMRMGVMVLPHFPHQVLRHGVGLFNNLQQLLSRQLRTGRRHNGRLLVQPPQQFHVLLHLGGVRHIRAAQHNGAGIFNLVVEKLTEILHIHPALGGVHHGHGAVENHVHVAGHVPHRLHHVRQLAHAGGLDDNPIRMVFGQHLFQRFAEISHQRAADAAGIHLPDLDAGLFQKSSVNADLAEFIFNQHHLFAGNGLFQQFFNKCRLSSSQKAGYDINFCHSDSLLSKCLFCHKPLLKSSRASRFLLPGNRFRSIIEVSASSGRSTAHAVSEVSGLTHIYPGNTLRLADIPFYLSCLIWFLSEPYFTKICRSINTAAIPSTTSAAHWA